MIKPKKSVEKMNGYCVPMYENNWDIKIDSNENNYGPSQKVIDALKKCNVKDISFYPFYGELSTKVADFYDFEMGNIKVTNGADEAIQGIIQTYLEEGETLLTLDISFEMPNIYAQIQGGKIKKVAYKEKWIFPIDDFLKEINKDVKIIYLASPNNPTGNLISENDIKRIIEVANDKIIIIDETYANYSETTYKKYVKEYNNIFIVRSFSKDFALAGMRLGCIISATENINNLKKVISPFSVNALAMKAGIAALNDSEYFYTIREEINSSKKELKIFLENLGAKVYDSYANFLLVDFGKKAEFIYNKLKKENIAVKLFKKGSLLENHLRITIPTKDGIAKLKEALKIKPALVFDMDGVLVDARNSYRVTIEKTFEKLAGKKTTPEKIQAAKNLGGLNNDWDLTMYLLEQEGIKVTYQSIVEIFQEIYWNDGKGLINNETPLFEKELFKKLSKEYNLSIFTGRLRAEAMFALEKFGASDLFFPILTTDDIPHGMGKPNPYGLDLTKDMTIASEYTYFGDTSDDILTAKSADFNPIGVLPPQDKSEELIQSLKDKGANFVLNSINDIETILEQKNEAKC